MVICTRDIKQHRLVARARKCCVAESLLHGLPETLTTLICSGASFLPHSRVESNRIEMQHAQKCCTDLEILEYRNSCSVFFNRVKTEPDTSRI